MLTLAVILSLVPQESAPTPSPAPTPTEIVGVGVHILHLGEDREVRGLVLKETADAVFVDLGFDVVRVPIAAIVRRSHADREATSRIVDAGIFRTAERPEMSVQEGASEVGPSVVKIETAAGQGSGFITGAEGYVVTNFHVVEGEAEADVVLHVLENGAMTTRTLRKCKVIAQNPQIDLALIKIEPPADLSLPAVFIGDSEGVQVGDRVYAIGAPIGLDRTVSSGMVSVTNRSFGGHTMLQTTTPINPGNSGGPLFNLRGQVVGVNSAGYMGLQGLNFAIPSKYVKDFLRNREAFAVDGSRSEKGIHFLPAPRRPRGDGKVSDG